MSLPGAEGLVTPCDLRHKMDRHLNSSHAIDVVGNVCELPAVP